MNTPITSYKIKTLYYGDPDQGFPESGIMFVFYDDDTKSPNYGLPLMVEFLCPCGCGRDCPIHLETPTTSSPRHWKFSLNLQRPTLTPSVMFVGGCKVHFNITDGKVIIHGDSGK